MPRASVAVTVSAPKYLRVIVGIVAISLLTGGFLYERSLSIKPQVVLNGQRYMLTTARTSAAQEKGLSGKDSLASNNGMLFIFPQPGQQCFWMKGMKFSIDMVWLDSSQTITKIEPQVSPDSYPAIFCPTTDTMWTLELPAGAVNGQHLRLGQHLQLQNI